MCKSKKFLQIYGRDFVGKTAYLVFFCVKQPTDACFLYRHAYGFFYKKATTSFKLAVVVVTLQCLKGRRGNAGEQIVKRSLAGTVGADKSPALASVELKRCLGVEGASAKGL